MTNFHETLSARTSAGSSSDRAFGTTFGAVFALLGCWLFYREAAFAGWSMGAAAVFFLAAWLAPARLAPLNRAWLAFGYSIHRVVSPVVLGFMFFGVVLPTGLIMRMLGKNPLQLQFDPDAKSYWIERDPQGPRPDGFRDQF